MEQTFESYCINQKVFTIWKTKDSVAKKREKFRFCELCRFQRGNNVGLLSQSLCDFCFNVFDYSTFALKCRVSFIGRQKVLVRQSLWTVILVNGRFGSENVEALKSIS